LQTVFKSFYIGADSYSLNSDWSSKIDHERNSGPFIFYKKPI